jgi:hypothetical protein
LPPDSPDFHRRWLQALQIHFNWSVNDGLVEWQEAGRVTDMGHAVYAEDGADERQPSVCPFETVEEVWAFDAVEEYGLPDESEQVAAYEAFVQARRDDSPDQLTPGGTYKTIMSGAV